MESRPRAIATYTSTLLLQKLYPRGCNNTRTDLNGWGGGYSLFSEFGESKCLNFVHPDFFYLGSVSCRCDREEILRAESGMRRMLTNPFKSTIPLIGDYDINVLLEALKLRRCRVSLHAVFNPKVSRAVASEEFDARR